LCAVERHERAAGVEGDTLILSGITTGAFFADRYRIDGPLGTGAMGKVFRATDLTSGSPVALKVLHPDKARKEQVLARFRREAQILAEIRHPGVVRVIDSGRAAGIDYPAMEILVGETLRDHLRERGALSPRELLRSSSRSPTRSAPRTPRASCIATSSPRT
jgi:serine/threonine protein kinase